MIRLGKAIWLLLILLEVLPVVPLSDTGNEYIEIPCTDSSNVEGEVLSANNSEVKLAEKVMVVGPPQNKLIHGVYMTARVYLNLNVEKI